jgi:hypothetical protein
MGDLLTREKPPDLEGVKKSIPLNSENKEGSQGRIRALEPVFGSTVLRDPEKHHLARLRSRAEVSQSPGWSHTAAGGAGLQTKRIHC